MSRANSHHPELPLQILIPGRMLQMASTVARMLPTSYLSRSMIHAVKSGPG
jgi:hypothetical protein